MIEDGEGRIYTWVECSLIMECKPVGTTVRSEAIFVMEVMRDCVVGMIWKEMESNDFISSFIGLDNDKLFTKLFVAVVG